MKSQSFGVGSPRSFIAYPRGEFDLESGLPHKIRKPIRSLTAPPIMLQSFQSRIQYLYKKHPILQSLASLLVGVSILIFLSIYESQFRMMGFQRTDFLVLDPVQYPLPKLSNLVMVAGHAIYTSNKCGKLDGEDSWFLESYQKHPGQAATFIAHIKEGVEAASRDEEALLLFSGGETHKDAGPCSEAQSYWAVAESDGWHEYVAYTLAEAERFHDCYEIIALYKRAQESFSSHGSQRMACLCTLGMAREYYASEDFSNSKQLFDTIAALYRREGWMLLLWEVLGYLRDCAKRLGLKKEYVSYSLEMAALPAFSISSEKSVGSGPAGMATLARREEIQMDALHFSVETDGKHEHVSLDIDPVSPLRSVLLVAVAFHEQSVKPGFAATVTVSLLSQLPLPFKVDSLEVEFNEPACNITMSEPLEMLPNKWLRLTREVTSGQSGKVECLSVKVKINNNLTIGCRVESPAIMEDLAMWKYENIPETYPILDPALSLSGQKFIQVEEPNPLVDLTLNSAGPALVGEVFRIPVHVVSTGHVIRAGELKINLVDARGGGMLMSPRETDESDAHHVELLSISGLPEDKGDPKPDMPEETESDNIKKIQYSFGVVSIPVLKEGESWSCNLEIKWHRPKSVMLYVSLGYNPGDVDQRINVHRSLQIEGKVPFLTNHRFMTPFRREPLLISNIRSLISPGEEQKVSLALKENNIVTVSTKNCTEVPLKLVSMKIVPEGGTDSSEKLFAIQEISGISDNHNIRFVPGEEFRGVFSITPLVANSNLSLGVVCLEWMRESPNQDQPQCRTVTTKHSLPRVCVEEPPLVAAIECPPYAIAGSPFSLHVKVKNTTSLLQEIKCSIGDSQNFVFCGAHVHSTSILPGKEHVLSYKFVALTSGTQQLPKIAITSVRYSAQLTPSVAASTIFVYPSEPKFSLEKNETQIAV